MADNRNESKSLQETLTEIKMTWPTASTNPNPHTKQNVEHANDDDTTDERQRQIIIHGFNHQTEETTINTTIRSMLNTYNFMDKVEDVYTFSETSNIGVVLFYKRPSMQKFFDRMR